MKNNLLKEISQVVFFSAIVFFSSYYFVPGVANAINQITEGYHLVPFVTQTLTLHSYPCKEITANGSRGIFMPTNSTNEYASFLAHKPSDVSIVNCAVPDTCETQTVTWGDETYTGVRIGDQCWMDRNLDYGTLLTASQEPSDNGVVEKVCPNNTENGCENGGGALYRSSEAMAYSGTEGTQGVCPPGWHIPTKAEHDLLVGENQTYLSVRTALGPNTSFDGEYTGWSVWAFTPPSTYNWTMSSVGTQSKILTSSSFVSGTEYTYVLDLNTTYNGPYSSPSIGRYGSESYSVRCIKGTYISPPPMD